MNDFLFGLMIALSVGCRADDRELRMRAGTASGVRAAVGVATADGCYAVVAFTLGAMLASTLAAHLLLFRLVGALVLLAMGARMLWQALRDRRRTLDGDARPPGSRPFSSMFFVTLANPLTILLFYGYATAAAGAHRHWLLGAACVFAGTSRAARVRIRRQRDRPDRQVAGAARGEPCGRGACRAGLRVAGLARL